MRRCNKIFVSWVIYIAYMSLWWVFPFDHHSKTACIELNGPFSRPRPWPCGQTKPKNKVGLMFSRMKMIEYVFQNNFTRASSPFGRQSKCPISAQRPGLSGHGRSKPDKCRRINVFSYESNQYSMISIMYTYMHIYIFENQQVTSTFVWKILLWFKLFRLF